MTSPPNAPQRQTALVTGASVGLGYELAKLFAADRYDVVLVARTEDKLNEVKRELESANGIQAHVVVADLADPASAQTIYDAVAAKQLRIDVLVNNAGFGGFGFFHQTDLQHELHMIQVNIASLVALTKLFVRDMTARGNGRIMNVSSTAAYQPGPLQCVYYATKAFVSSFSEALDNEVDGSGVRITSFCPGPTHTEFHARANTKRSFDKIKIMDAPTAARIGYEGMKKGKRVVIAGFQNRVLALGARLSPRSWSTAIARSLQDQKGE